MARAATALAIAAVLAACASSRPDIPGPVTDAPPATAAPTVAASPPPQLPCGNPVASYDPSGFRPFGGGLPAGSYMAEIRKRGRLIVGVDGATTLFSARNPLTGKLEGFDIDILREVAKAIFGDPDKIEYRVIPYSQRVQVLETKSVDVVADTFTINCARWNRISFSSEYFHAGQRLLVRSDSPYTSIQLLNRAKGSVCVPKGSTNLDNLAPYKDVRVVAVDDLGACLVLFQDGSVDAVTADDTVLQGFKSEDPYAKVVGAQFSEEPYGLGVSRAYPEFVRFINGVLEDVRSDGTWKAIYERWLGRPVPEPPKPVYGRRER